ncbi:hypothetical protein O1611_g4622 [Lasiodiplodia mahajangana]|uniref:Uncharacterized protein n=1 Tax=Lasiodiplodia mahajangana TaxID=1108764 RepID=A0ACC2JNK0_9PEZI|nr:hypothetical protein O1611_g4622 [Lasiodiplodia mahajangana]
MTSGIGDICFEDALGEPPSKRPRVLSKAQRGQPGLRPGYGKAVEQRLGTLEENVEKINRTLEGVLERVRGGKVVLQQHTSETMLEEDAQQWQGTEQTLALTSSAPESPIIQPPLSHSSILPNRGLPPEAIMEKLVDLFFDKVYAWAPIFYKPYFTANMQSPERQVLLHGIVVVAFRYWKHSDPSPELQESYVRSSREKILLETIDSCSLVSTQALSLLVIDAIGQGPTPRTWKVMAMLYTAVQELGLAKSHSLTDIDVDTPLVRNEDPNDDLDLSIIEAEEKRRLFWLIYRQDQFSGVSRGQAGTINVNDIHLPYPAGEDEWGVPITPTWFEAMPQLRPTTMQPSNNVLWQHYIDVMVFLDRTNQLLVKPVNLSLPAHCQEWQSNFRRLDTTLSSWFENLPREVKDPPASFDPIWVMLYATFHLNRIRMYTVAAFPSTTSPYMKPSSSGRGRCRDSVKKVVSLVTSIQPHELEQLGPMFAFVVWVASRSLVILWTSGYETTYETMPTDLKPMMWTLRQMAMHWPCAQRYVDIIQLILDTKYNPGGPTGLEIFNDTRRTAYGLQNRLGKLAGNRVNQALVTSFDFLDIPLPDAGEFGLSCSSSFALGMGDEWLSN